MSRPVPIDRAGLALALLLFLGTVLLYVGVGEYAFLSYDDDQYVTENEVVMGGLSARGLAWAVTSTGYACNWHPLTWASHMLDVSLFGMENPGGHHWMSVVLHALNGALLFVLLRSLTGARWRSFLVAALFAWHPLRVESVAWISERKDVLSGLFFLLSLWAYIRWVRRPTRRRRLLLLLAFTLGLTAKPMLVTLPCVLLLLDHWPLQRRASLRALLIEKLPLFALSGVSCCLTLVAQTRGGCTEFIHDGVGVFARLGNAAGAYMQYIGKTLLPTDLAVFYPHPAVVDPEGSRLATILVASLLILGISALAFRLRRRVPAVALGWLWFLGMLSPVIGVLQVGGQALADRYSYLSTIGICIALVWGLDAWAGNRAPRRRLLTLLAAAALVSVGVLTRLQLPVWTDSRTLFEHALEVTERNYVAHSNLGLLDGRAAEKALRAEDERATALLASATRHNRAAIGYAPRFFEGRIDLAWALILADSHGEAVEHLEIALSIRPHHSDALFKLGWALTKLGEWERARVVLLEAQELDPAKTSIGEVLRLVEGQLGASE